MISVRAELSSLRKPLTVTMSRGGSFGGGESSLGYLFGGGDAPKPAKATGEAAALQNPIPAPAASPSIKPAASTEVDITKLIPAGIPAKPSNNYFRADGQNTGNFITVSSLFLTCATCETFCL